MLPRLQTLWLTLGLALTIGPTRAAEPTPPETPPSDPPVELTPEELKAIEESLGAPTPSAPAPASPAFLQSMNPDMSLVLDVTGAWFSKEEPLQLGGHDPARTGFTFQQLELHASANVDPFFRLDANIVFAEVGVEVEEAFATTLALPAGLQMRVGQFLTRFGKRNPTHPHQWGFLDQPLVLGKFFGSESARGLGLELSWLTPLPWYVEVIAAAQGAAGECCARSFYGGLDAGVRGPEDLRYTLAVKQFFDLSRDWAFQWGLSAMLGPNGTGHGNRTGIYGTDLFLRWKPTGSAGRQSVDLLLELMLRAREVPGDSLVDWGLFAELRWQIDAEWALGLRHDAVGGVEDDPLDPAWTGLAQRTALAVDLWPSHFSRLRLQGGLALADWQEAPGGFVMLGLEVAIGAHGAHAY
ncbi:MAG: zinc-regulated TonB-dependent outer membrane receptor [Deltaproteobacteria bacterium]|nr:zinc-regulated TonB-dependent outer membrane receptor [Deltaproteobacteria bacterium]